MQLIASRYFCLTVEAVLATLLLVLAVGRRSQTEGRWWAALERRFVGLAARKRLSILLTMALALFGRALLLPILEVPQPSIHDEFSYLLAGETFASGRVTNPPHPMWIHFESVHILQQPTYMSMYQPAQGLFLALGRCLTGSPWVGVWFSVTLLSGAICWMLQGWLSPAAALLGGLLFVMRWGLFSYWTNGYWGGAVPALGGALVLGSLPRLLRERRATHGVLLGLGLALLAASRPFEGLVFSTAAMVAFFIWVARHHRLRSVLSSRTIVPAAAVVICAGAAMLYYNARITGSPVRLPYVVARQQYGIAPLFLWQRLRPEPAYHSTSLRNVYRDEVTLYRKGKAHWGIPEAFRKLKDFWLFYLGPLFTIPVVALFLPKSRLDDRTKFFLLLIGTLLVALAGEVWFYAHYAAPAMCVVVALIVEGMRRLRRLSWKQNAIGLFLSRMIPATLVLLPVIPISAALAHIPLEYWPMQWYTGALGDIKPASLTAPFVKRNERLLIIVKYGPNHDVGNEWVYNAADIDGAAVVWARSIDPASDATLVRYFHDRKAFLFEPDKHPWILQPYESPTILSGRRAVSESDQKRSYKIDQLTPAKHERSGTASLPAPHTGLPK